MGCARLRFRAFCESLVHTGTQDQSMQRSRAIAIAAKQQAENNRLMIMLGLLLLPALLLLLISP